MIIEKKGIVLLDAAAFLKGYLTQEQLTQFIKILPSKKVEEISVLLQRLCEGTKITMQPVKRDAENGNYSYNVVEIKGKNGVMPFYISYHPQIEKFLMDYLSGRVVVAFKLEEIYQPSN